MFIVLAVCCMMISGICFFRYNVLKKRGRETDYDGGGIAFIFIALIIGIFGIIASGAGWLEQIDDSENIQKFSKVEAIYRTKAEALTAEFAKYLAETYPKHERDIYGKISPDKVALYAVKYPELKASETLMALVAQINKLQSDVYTQQINAEEARKRMRVRLRNPWLCSFMIPKE